MIQFTKHVSGAHNGQTLQE